jgi:predicted ATPase
VLLLDDLLGIADPEAPLPLIDPDARRRRLTALLKAASLAREYLAVYVVEDAHWIDEASDSMLADLVTVIPQTPSLVLVTYRPEYEGALARVRGALTIALAPLRDSETAALVSELLGPDPSVRGLGDTIANRAAGNPFFAEEIVRELAERRVLHGKPGAYVSMEEVAEVSVPATLQATIAARIDRLLPAAKRTLSAAAVIGSRFNLDLLAQLARAAGQGAGRRRSIPRLPRSLPRDGQRAWLRGAHEVGRGDAMTGAMLAQSPATRF